VDDSSESEKASAFEATGIVALPRVLSGATKTTDVDLMQLQQQQQEQEQLLLRQLQEQEQDLKDEVLNFPTNCPECSAPADTNMKVTSKLLSRYF
jgi:hypothetical protein